MRVCLVSKATAQHYKRGTRLPSPQAHRLWWLHVQGRILGEEWHSFRVRGTVLINPDGHEFTEEEIRKVPFLYTKIAELERALDRIRFVGEVCELDFWDIERALRDVHNEGEKLKEVLERIPKRYKSESRSPETIADRLQGSRTR